MNDAAEVDPPAVLAKVDPPAVLAKVDPPEVLKVGEFAKLVRLNPKTIYAMIAEGKELPGLLRIGSSLRFHRATVVAWLAGQEAPRPAPKGRTR